MNQRGMVNPKIFTDAEALTDAVIAHVGKRIVLGLPLGLGKANSLANALFARAEADPSLSLTIFTALTLEVPAPGSELAKRFFKPLQQRFFAGYPRLAYARALKDNNLPSNIKVHEFFLQPGNWLGNQRVQQDYVSLNYTHALPFLLDVGVNVVGQLIAPAKASPDDAAPGYSLSCNPDITVDLIDLCHAGKLDCLIVGEVNSNLPFMQGAARRRGEDFDFILDSGQPAFGLFMPPQQPVTLTDHALALQVASLVADGGTLQIGIGSIGDAVAHALILRQQHNNVFRQCLHRLNVDREQLEPRLDRHEEVFNTGLYGLSEMLAEGFLSLINAGVIKREVDGYLMHASFFMGSPHFYKTLTAIDDAIRQKIAMMPVSYVNELYGQEQAKRSGRVKARFINSCIIATLVGDVVSNGLESGQVISGVGGQYNFVAQAFALEDAHSIITLRSTRTRKGKVESNIHWSYGHVTIPRHLRDIVVTEYGVANLRGKSDAEVIAAMLSITDSRFQKELLRQAQHSGKIAADYQIPDAYQNNTPARISSALSVAQAEGHLNSYPLGGDFSPEEQQLVLALKNLNENAGSPLSLLSFMRRGWRHSPDDNIKACLKRMELDNASTPKALLLRYLLIGALLRNQS